MTMCVTMCVIDHEETLEYKNNGKNTEPFSLSCDLC